MSRRWPQISMRTCHHLVLLHHLWIVLSSRSKMFQARSILSAQPIVMMWTTWLLKDKLKKRSLKPNGRSRYSEVRLFNNKINNKIRGGWCSCWLYYIRIGWEFKDWMARTGNIKQEFRHHSTYCMNQMKMATWNYLESQMWISAPDHNRFSLELLILYSVSILILETFFLIHFWSCRFRLAHWDWSSSSFALWRVTTRETRQFIERVLLWSSIKSQQRIFTFCLQEYSRRPSTAPWR